MMNFPRTIYAIRHNPTGRIYVGSSAKPEARIRGHLNCLRRHDHSIPEMQEDFIKYGEDYTFFNLGEIKRFDERYLEYFWMDFLRSRDPMYGYNIHDRSKPLNLADFPKIDIS